MIIYSVADSIYFDLYFDLWSQQMNKFYPHHRKIIAVHGLNDSIQSKAQQANVDLVEVSPATGFVSHPIRNHFYLMRWMYLPYQHNENILETQINCLPVNSSQDFPEDNLGVEHLRISRWKRKKGQEPYKGGVSAAVFTPYGAKKVVEQASKMIDSAPETDHPMNVWQEDNLVHEHIISEQQFPKIGRNLRDNTRWITSASSTKFSASKKLEILQHYINL